MQRPIAVRGHPGKGNVQRGDQIILLEFQKISLFIIFARGISAYANEGGRVDRGRVGQMIVGCLAVKIPYACGYHFLVFKEVSIRVTKIAAVFVREIRIGDGGVRCDAHQRQMGAEKLCGMFCAVLFWRCF